MCLCVVQVIQMVKAKAGVRLDAEGFALIQCIGDRGIQLGRATKHCDKPVCLSVCLSACISQKLHVQISHSFFIPTTLADDDSETWYILPVLWMTLFILHDWPTRPYYTYRQ